MNLRTLAIKRLFHARQYLLIKCLAVGCSLSAYTGGLIIIFLGGGSYSDVQSAYSEDQADKGDFECTFHICGCVFLIPSCSMVRQMRVYIIINIIIF